MFQGVEVVLNFLLVLSPSLYEFRALLLDKFVCLSSEKLIPSIRYDYKHSVVSDSALYFVSDPGRFPLPDFLNNYSVKDLILISGKC